MNKRFIVVFLIFIFMIFEYFNTFEQLESMARDFNYKDNGYIDSRIIIVGIDDDSLENIGKWPWKRKTHSELINVIEKGNPAVIGFDVMLTEEDDDLEEDKVLAETLSNYDNIIFPVVGVFDSSLKSNNVIAKSIIKPVEILKKHVDTGHINVIPDIDGVVRNSLLKFEYKDELIYSFSWQIYNMYIENKTGEKKILESEIPIDNWNRMHINFYGKPFDMEYMSYEKVLYGEIPVEYFKNKIVLVGAYSLGINDYYSTSVERQVPMYGIEIHANIIQNFLDGNLKSNAPFSLNFLILILIALTSYFLINKLSLIKSTILIALSIILYYVISIKIYKTGLILYLIYPVFFLILINLFLSMVDYLYETKERKYIKDMFGRYVSKQVVDKILIDGKEGIKLGGIRKEATFIFVDIRNFTVLSEKLNSEEVVEIINKYLNIFANSILEYGGTLDKFIGDAAMGIFNAPLEVVDHPLKAVKAAWKMKQDSIEINKYFKEKYNIEIHFGIGINTGQAIIGNIGSEFRMDYTAIGDAVNTASRLEGVAKGNQILISENVYEYVKDNVTVEYLGEIKVKGKNNLIKTYEVKGIGYD